MKIIIRKCYEIITNKIAETNFDEIILQNNSNEKWYKIKKTLLPIIDQIAPLKEIKIKNNFNYPWVDTELIEARNHRDKLHKIHSNSQLEFDFLIASEAKTNYNSLLKSKMIEYFKNKSANDFKSSKKFWEFYSTSVKLKSDKCGASSITITKNNETVSEPEEIGKLFNLHFTTLASESKIEKKNGTLFIENLFEEIKKNRTQNDETAWPTNHFKFNRVDDKTVNKLLTNLSTTSGSGASGLSSKVLKAAANQLTSIVRDLFNTCIETCEIPDEWKLGIVTPIFKNKGSNEDMNNYRGITVISPIAKLFEKILATQITSYLNENSILFNGQHGFRYGHSCETALHEIISEMNRIKDRKSVV